MTPSPCKANNPPTPDFRSMPTCRSLTIALMLSALLLPLMAGCDRDEKFSAANPARETPPPAQPGCQGCHAVRLDPDHAFACPTCHNGDATGATAATAHRGMIALPAHPANMDRVCGRCHRQQAAGAAKSSHFTLTRTINSVRKAFGATTSLATLTAIPVEEPPTTPLALADDLLRRRCLRCHLYYQGDPYPETEHGTGCAACHLSFHDNAMQGHRFVRYPDDSQCLHCHHGNRVGGDYYGRYERDFSMEFRTPYRTEDNPPRPYGVEYHQLRPDVHQLAGIACIDCHSGAQLMGGGRQDSSPSLTCDGCHGWQPGQPPPAANLLVKEGRLILVTKLAHKQLSVPPRTNPVHRQYRDKATCVACHAQWGFNDQGTHLLRQDADDYEAWSYLTVQGSLEVEAQLENNLYGGDQTAPEMIDKLTGEARPGLWYKGFEQRRWETALLCNDRDGRITVCRPSLDLHLSYVNGEGEVLFDAETPDPSTPKIRPYTPHTIGKAGAFFRQRLQAGRPANKKQEQP